MFKKYSILKKSMYNVINTCFIFLFTLIIYNIHVALSEIGLIMFRISSSYYTPLNNIEKCSGKIICYDL